MKISRSKTLTPDRYTRDPREGPDAPLIEIATNGVELDLGGCSTAWTAPALASASTIARA